MRRARARNPALKVAEPAAAVAAGRDPKKATAMDLGFILGPRLNAAGRLADMRLGVECLLTEDPTLFDGLVNSLRVATCTTILATAALAACWLPARRAAATPPTQALRCD